MSDEQLQDEAEAEASKGFSGAQVALFMLLLGHGNGGKERRDLVKALLARCLGKPGIHVGPLVVLACGPGRQVVGRIAYHTKREGARDLDVACGCFGTHDAARTGWLTLFRDLGMLALAFLGYPWGGEAPHSVTREAEAV